MDFLWLMLLLFSTTDKPNFNLPLYYFSNYEKYNKYGVDE